MMNRAATLFSLSIAAGVLLAASTAAAQTNCSPYDIFCAQVQIGPGQGTLRIGPGDPVPPPAPVLPAPQPPVVIVQPQAPAPVIPAPQPPQVYVAPQPPPPVYAQPQYVQPQYVQPPQYYRRVALQPTYPESSMGLQVHGDGIFTDRISMGGAGAALRIRPNPYIAIDLGAGIYGGRDYNGLDRAEIPVTADFLVFFNPYNRVQFYGLAGIGASWAHTSGSTSLTLTPNDRDLGYLGGELGLGLEWRINPGFALNFDVRGFLRQRVDNSSRPEFTERLADGTTHSTDTSGGFVGRLGMTFYWGQ